MDSSTVQQQQQQQQIFGDKKLKRKLIESVKSVKKKIKSLNEDKVELASTLQETFQPITKPLNTLLEQMDSKNNKTKEGKTETKLSNKEHDYNKDDDDDDEDSYEDADEESDPNNSSITSESMEELDSFQGDAINPLAKSYLDSVVINKVKKVPYGIHLQSNGCYIGDSIISFHQNYLIIKNVKFEYTPGLMELLFKKEPNEALVQVGDSANYLKIITMTNAHRRNFLPNGQIQGDRSTKYSLYIKQLSLPPSGKKGGCVNASSSSSSSMDMNKSLLMKKYTPNTDFKYWDDPNELIDRLRLLIGSQNAGNNSHNNEIIAIIEELQEANIIESS